MSDHPISKTLFLNFLHCPKNAWLKIHKPEVHAAHELSEFEKHIIEQGNEVEACARNLFPGGIEVVSRGEDACHETVRFMASKIPAIFQSTFTVDGFIARNDALVFDAKTDSWDLYEIKGTNSLKEGGSDHDHIDDVAFQVSVLNRANIKLGRYFLVHLNKGYVRSGNLDTHALFQIDDVTDKVGERMEKMQKEMETASRYLSQEKEPSIGGCECLYRGRSGHCTTFAYSNSHVPAYSVHDLSRVSEKKLNSLIENSIFDLSDVPPDMELSPIQTNQVMVHQRQKPMVDAKEIAGILSKLKFPLYFFDYEAYGPAIPAFDTFSPYQRIPFQFSLHILKDPNAELEHVEFLHEKLSDTSEQVAKLLKEKILPGGTVISWHKSYEQGVNKEISIRLPQYAELFQQINGSMYDLKEIFSKQLYVHPHFKGRASIKKVLPVLVPDMKYSELDIKEGGQAADAWWTMVSPAATAEEKTKTIRDLKTYCGLDTRAMYAIWKHLNGLNS